MNEVLTTAPPYGRRASDKMAHPRGPVSYDGKRDWLDELLETVKGMKHKSPTLVRALTLFEHGPITSHRLAYARFLDETMRSAWDFNRLITQFGGVPIETELKSIYGDRWAFIQASPGTARQAATWTAIFFERDGIKLEREFESAEAALNVLVDDGYILQEDDALFAISSEEGWIGGAQSAKEIGKPRPVDASHLSLVAGTVAA